ncbi:hypothetical protein MAL08_07405 [Leptospira noguchii]|uniref:hypothetical protein n=1 Tax=Leptospira noguchii TaxID=28182 RepID=UPI001FB6AF75|nr:hypothetical protein [Leptospira noguchii]UOG39616.1 hypothetical protein MAL08_07405 [Leptospira noguchii]
MERKRTTQHNAFLWVALWVVSHFNYEICERFAPIFLRRTHVIITSYRDGCKPILESRGNTHVICIEQ